MSIDRQNKLKADRVLGNSSLDRDIIQSHPRDYEVISCTGSTLIKNLKKDRQNLKNTFLRTGIRLTQCHRNGTKRWEMTPHKTEATWKAFLHSGDQTKAKLPPLHSMSTTFEISVVEETPCLLLSVPSLVPSVQEKIGEIQDGSWPHSVLHCDRLPPWPSLDVFEPRPLTWTH